MNKNFNYYLITDPKYYSNNIKIFEQRLINRLKNNRVDIICFRDKESKNFEELAKIFVKVCKEFNIKRVLLNQNISLAKELNCGIHLTSTQFDKIDEVKKAKLFTIISCHKQKDIDIAIEKKVDAITYSPIFETPNKEAPKGLKNLKNIIESNKIPIIALGGIINDIQVKQIKELEAYGFASIRYFI